MVQPHGVAMAPRKRPAMAGTSAAASAQAPARRSIGLVQLGLKENPLFNVADIYDDYPVKNDT